MLEQKKAQDLANLSDDELISNVKTKLCNDSFAVLSEKYEKVFYKICHKYSYALEKHGISVDDIFERKDEVLYERILKFDPSKGMRFSSYVGNYAKFLCLNSMTARKLLINYDDEEVKKFIEDNQQNNSLSDPPNYENLHYIYKSLKTKDLKDIIRLRYFNRDKLNWNSISKILGISIQTAISRHNRAIKTLKMKIKSKDSL